jgi:hydrogenase small subunit
VHWPLIDFECGPNGGADDFLEWFFKADRGELEPFVLVVEGSIPNEKIKDEGYWCGFGNNPETGQPLTTSEWLDKLAPKATAIVAAGTCATYGGIHAMAGNPTGAMGFPTTSAGTGSPRPASRSSASPVARSSRQPLGDADLPALHGHRPGADDPARRALRPTWLFGQTVHEGCDRAGYYEQGDFATEYGSPEVHRQARLLGPRS